MSNAVVVHKGRTNTVIIKLGFDVSADTFTSEIRSEPDVEGVLIASWIVDWVTDGTDGDLSLTMDNTITGAIDADSGYMDLKRVSAGEPLPVFDRPLEVVFRGSVTE